MGNLIKSRSEKIVSQETNKEMMLHFRREEALDSTSLLRAILEIERIRLHPRRELLEEIMRVW
jgi:hypothetical protein